MADPVSVASGLLTLVGFALQAGKTLYEVVQSFQSNRRTIRELKEELEALIGVLQSLQGAVDSSNVDFTALELPLRQCGKVCLEFEAVIVKCTAHCNGKRTSFRDWTMLMYMGSDIEGFKNMLAGYKSTIAIALGDATIRTATVTLDVLQQYKTLIENTTSDLVEHLQEIDVKLQNLSLQSKQTSDEAGLERRRIEEERESTKRCLNICNEVATHIDQVQANGLEGGAQVSTSSSENYAPARTVAGKALQGCKQELSEAMSRLEIHFDEMNRRLQKLPQRQHSTQTGLPDEQASIKQEMDSIKQCLTICHQAAEQAGAERINVFEDVSTADDGHQVIVATLGDLISAKRIVAGARSTQWLGQMADASLQQLAQGYGRRSPGKDRYPRSEYGPQAESRYGAGPKPDPKMEKDKTESRKKM